MDWRPEPIGFLEKPYLFVYFFYCLSVCLFRTTVDGGYGDIILRVGIG